MPCIRDGEASISASAGVRIDARTDSNTVYIKSIRYFLFLQAVLAFFSISFQGSYIRKLIAANCSDKSHVRPPYPSSKQENAAEISSPQEAAIDELNFTMDAHSAELLLPHVNLFTYGNEIIKDDNAALTSYGLLHREDYQPMQTPRGASHRARQARVFPCAAPPRTRYRLQSPWPQSRGSGASEAKKMQALIMILL